MTDEHSNEPIADSEDDTQNVQPDTTGTEPVPPLAADDADDLTGTEPVPSPLDAD